MGLQVRRVSSGKYKLLATVMVVFALVAQPMYGLVASQVASAASLTVCSTGCVYTSIQSAIDAASADDTVLVGDGTYGESVSINKSITLKSQNGAAVTTISPASGNAISLLGNVANLDDITIEGFTLEGNAGQVAIQANSQANDGYDYANLTYKDLVINANGGFGLGLFDVDGIAIDNVIITGATTAVEAIGVANLDMKNSEVSGSSVVGVNVLAAPGYEANNNLAFTGNTFSDNQTGLKFVNANNVTVTGGTVSGGGTGVQSQGSSTTVDGVSFSDIQSSTYLGTAVVGFGGVVAGGAGAGTHGANQLTVRNSTFADIGRIGVLVKGTSSTVAVEGITYTGKGAVNGLDYAVEFGAGGKGTVTGSIISGNQGTASTDGSTSAGILATDFYGSGTLATIEGNALTGNTTGVAVGYNVSDATIASIHRNNITGNTTGVKALANTNVDASENWWGHKTGPSGQGTGSGDAVSAHVAFSPWLCAPAPSAVTSATLNCNDPTAPSLTFPANNQVINTDTFTFTWTEVTGAVKYEFLNSATSSAVDANGRLTSINHTNNNVPSNSLNSSGAGEVTRWWQVRGVYADGTKTNWSTVWKMSIDKTAPAVPTASYTATPSNTVKTSGGYTTEKDFKFSLASASDTTRYQLKYSNDIEGAAVRSWSPTNLSGYQAGQGVNTYVDKFTQGEGKHYFSFSACDAAGNCSAYSTPFVINYDKTAPLASINAPTLTNNSNPLIAGVASDTGSGVKSHWFEVRAPNGTYYYVTGKSSFSLAEAKDGTAAKNPIVITDGEYRIRYVVTDNANNRNDDPNYTNPTLHTMKLDLTDPDGVVMISGTDTAATATLGSLTEAIKTPAGWTKVGSEYVRDAPHTANGNYSVEIEDLAGNTRTIHYSVSTIDDVAPVVTVTSVVRGSDGRYTISGTTSDDADMVDVLLNGTTSLAATVTGGTWTAVTDVLPVGPYSVSATSTDTAGNIGVAALYTFTVYAPIPLAVTPTAERPRSLPEAVDTTTILNTPVAVQGAGIVTLPTTEDEADEEGAVLGASDDENKAPLESTASVLGAEAAAGKYFGLMWYWWLLALAALVAGWWLIAAARRRRRDDEA